MDKYMMRNVLVSNKLEEQINFLEMLTQVFHKTEKKEKNSHKVKMKK